jgi:RimJ/RimL family protein N-acetyltransferase
MLHGRSVTLREVRRSDLPIIHRELSTDVVTSAGSSAAPWRPVSLARLEAEFDAALERTGEERAVRFAVQELGDEHEVPIGTGTVWAIDTHNRTAHIGLALVPSVRGRGLGRDVVAVLCRYAFTVRGLHRLGLETLASNAAMRATALAAGFKEEGVLRESAFVLGGRQDEVLFGLLCRDWTAREQHEE